MQVWLFSKQFVVSMDSSVGRNTISEKKIHSIPLGAGMNLTSAFSFYLYHHLYYILFHMMDISF